MNSKIHHFQVFHPLQYYSDEDMFDDVLEDVNDDRALEFREETFERSRNIAKLQKYLRPLKRSDTKDR